METLSISFSGHIKGCGDLTEPLRPFFPAGMQKGRPSGRPLPFHAAGARFSPVPADMLNKKCDKNSITKRPSVRMACLFYWMPGSSLLSHGETPHYHRRYGVSLLSSAWGQVGPPRSCRQANSLCGNESFSFIRRWFPLCCSVTYLCMLLLITRLPPCLNVKSFIPTKLLN